MPDSRLSHVQGADRPPIIEDTVGRVLARAAERWPDVEALVSLEQSIRWSYAEFNRRVDALAAGLLALGLQPGDRVGMWAPNCAEWTLTQFATGRLGLIQVNINPAYRLSELEYTLNKVGVKALIAAESFKSSEYLRMLDTLAPELARSTPGTLRAARLPHLKWAIKLGAASRPGWLNFDAIAATGIDGAAGSAGAAALAAVRAAESRTDRKQAINIQFTSGTTGLPKGATLSHRNLVNNAYFVGLSMGLKERDRLCVPVPLYHCFGMVMSNLTCVLHGATLIYPSRGFDPLAVLQAVQDERCTALHGVPTMFIAQLEHPQFARFDLTSLRTGIMAGSPCPIEVMRRVVERMHMRDITIAYGMTETSPVSFQSSVNDTLERRVTTVGRIQPHLEGKVVDGEGRTVPRGEAGELCTRGYSVMLGYWEDPERTAEAIDAEGWMHTGDLGVIDADGYCNIVGRSKDMIIRGGENVYPTEIEQFLFRHPKIQDVAVIGVPDSKYGEEICAWVRLRANESATEQDIREFCDGQIAHFKVPRYVVIVSEFPTTVTGKIQKYLIRQEMIARLSLTEQAHA